MKRSENRWLGAALGLTLAGLVVSLVTGCSANEIKQGEAVQPATDEGIVVMSVTRSGRRDFDMHFELSGPGQWVPRPIVMLADSRARDWKGGDDRLVSPGDDPGGRLVVLRLKPGSYRIAHWRGESSSGGLYSDGYLVQSGDLAVDFTVQPGTITYVGSLHLQLPDKLDFAANLAPAFYTLEVEDRSSRDLALFRERFPDAGTVQVASRPMEFAQAGQPLRYYLFNYSTDGDKDSP